MTVSSLINRNVYAGAGTVGPFTTDFPVLAAADLLVIRRRPVGDVVLAVTTDYTVAGLGQERATITLVQPLLVGETLVVIRDPVPTQLQDYTPADRFPAEALERQLDRLTMVAQRLFDVVNRTIRGADVDPVLPRLPPANVRAGQLLGFDAAGAPIAAAPGSVGTNPVTVTAFAATLLDDPTAADARTTLGFSSVGQSVGTSATQAAARTALGMTALGSQVATSVTTAEARAALEVPALPAQIVNTVNGAVGHVNVVTSFEGLVGAVQGVLSVNGARGHVTVSTTPTDAAVHGAYSRIEAHWVGSISAVQTISTLSGSGRPPPWALNLLTAVAGHPGTWRVLANANIQDGQNGPPATHAVWTTVIVRVV